MLLTWCYSSLWLLWGWGEFTTPITDCASLWSWRTRGWEPPHWLPGRKPASFWISYSLLSHQSLCSGANSWYAWRSEWQRSIFCFHREQHIGPCPQESMPTPAHSLPLLPSLFLSCGPEFLLSSGPEMEQTKLSKCLSLSAQAQKPGIWIFGGLVVSALHWASDCAMAVFPVGKGHCIRRRMEGWGNRAVNSS